MKRKREIWITQIEDFIDGQRVYSYRVTKTVNTNYYKIDQIFSEKQLDNLMNSDRELEKIVIKGNQIN